MPAATGPANSGDWRPATIVVGYDGTSHAERALGRAIELARAFGSLVVVADVAVLMQFQETPGAFGYGPFYGVTPELGAWTNEPNWRQHRSSIEALFAQSGVRHEFAGVIGEPVAEIVDVAEQRNADLIVVGTREPSFLERLVEGSVSQGVARRAECDVLIVHPDADEKPEAA
jgi:nucleotide-binding universal stress UspA family protein